jgi:Bacterial Ig-like domain
MKKPVLKIILSLLLSVFLFFQLLFQAGCANIVPPEGGLKDTLPPVLTRATPPNNTRNFPVDRFTLSFDEYIDLDNYQQNLIVSPLPENMPTITRKLNTITVKLRDSIEPNTTYTFDFGKSIKDINEGNPMKDFTYIFSTGPYMDSLEFSGRVLLAETGEPDSTLTIMLHRSSEDSVVIKNRPRYIARTNGNGSFHFTHLPPDTFYIYALKDEGSYRYLSPKQLFAFADSPVKVAAQTDSVILYAYTADKTESAAASPARGNNKPADKRLKFQSNLNQNKQDLTEKFILTFETPLRDFDSSKIHFSTDSTYLTVSGYSWTLDSTKKKLVLDYNWKENTLHNLILEKDFATDTLGQQLLKTDTIQFTTKARVEYGKLTLRFRNLDLSKNPVLQFVQGNEVKKSFPLTGETFSVALFEPGEYNLRILQDGNKNGRWDPGEFFGKHKQPELVKPVSRKITVRQNWEDTVEIVL